MVCPNRENPSILLPEDAIVKTLRNLTPLVLSALVLAACGDKGDSAKPATQVAAKVNSAEISVHQINYLLQRVPGLKPEQAQAARKQALESLIDQELAVQQAVEGKLDRVPEVLQALEAARREILSRAYLERQVGKEKPAADDVRKYYNDHPELFSARKIYRMEETGFPATPENLAAVREIVAGSKTSAEVAAALKAKGIESASGIAVKPAEQIAMEILPRLAQQKEGQPQLFESGDKAAIITVLATRSDPMTEARATPVIEQFLAAKHRSEQARAQMKQLREKAKVEYMGEFTAGAPAAKAETLPAAAKTEPAPDAAINKGIAGLK